MKNYDVIIVGAGPAGLNCAKKLVENGISVLILEKNSKIGSKVCAGGLTNKSLRYLNLPSRLLDRKFKKIIFCTPLNKICFKLDRYFIYTVDREKLGQWQMKKLKGGNIEIKTNSQVTKIDENKVIVNNSEIFGYKYLVGADGSTSIVRRYLGLNFKNIIGIQYIVKTKMYKDLEIHFDSKLFGLGYAWIFPHKNYVSIGCGSSSKNLKINDKFNFWLKKNRFDISLGEYQASPINVDFCGYKFGNVFLAGDAAGLASELTGEGIYQALISGEEVAKTILDKNYVSLKINELIEMKKRHRKVINIFSKFGFLKNNIVELFGLALKNEFLKEKIVENIGKKLI